jgi:hypothetical protein
MQKYQFSDTFRYKIPVAITLLGKNARSKKQSETIHIEACTKLRFIYEKSK